MTATRWPGLAPVVASVLVLFALGCVRANARDWGAFDVLRDTAPRPPQAVGGVPVTPDDYLRFVAWGEEWFRDATFGNERTNNDVIGIMNGTVQVPCGGSAPGSCYRDESVLKYFVRALDALDGVFGNLYIGNGGPDGPGFTNDLVVDFPPGTLLYDAIPVPEHLHTGLDVEAGAVWPLGIVPVAAPREDQNLPYLPNPPELGAGPAPGQDRVRLGMTCALCHYSLDVDWDGRPDLRSARLDHPTPGSPYSPDKAWAVGNQDIHVGWLLALSANPLVGFTVLSGPIGVNDPDTSLRWASWIRDNYARAPQAVLRQVALGMILQPRGYSDDTPDGRHNPMQFPSLYTRQNWPFNIDGALLNPSDGHNSIWTVALDFTSLVGFCKDRAGSQQSVLFWEPPALYSAFTAEELADVFVNSAPAVRYDPSIRRALKDDILGLSDGVPGLLHPDSVVVMPGLASAVPPEVFNHPANRVHRRYRQPSDLGGDAPARGPLLAMLGIRVITPSPVRCAYGIDALAQKYPGLDEEEFVNESVGLMLDWLDPPPNRSALLVASMPLVRAGYQVFREEGCASCHRGPFFTDNVVHRNFATRDEEVGIGAPSTAGWTFPGRDEGPVIGTNPVRAIGTRPLQLYVAPAYDPATGKAVQAGGVLSGIAGSRIVGYKTATLRYLWGSAPYLHDGGVAVSLNPSLPGNVEGTDLSALLRRAPSDLLYGLGQVLQYREAHPDSYLRPDAALSLQALLLESERARVVRANQEPVVPVPPGDSFSRTIGREPPREVSMELLGVTGIGHDFFVHDERGGPRITALIAFLLALDDNPGVAP